MDHWRLLDTSPMSAAENMALDEILLELRSKDQIPNTIRFLQFRPRAVLVGYHQCVDHEIRRDYCLSEGIDINRRITGGGAIYFDESQLGWEIICDKGFFDIKIPTVELFKKMCQPIIYALNSMGIGASFRPRNDIEVRGRKISGTGGTDRDNAFLFQGTLLTDFDVEGMIRALRIPVEKLKAKEIESLKDRVTCLRWELGYVPDISYIKKVVADAIEKIFNIRLLSGNLSDLERRLLKERVSYFSSKRWIDKVSPGSYEREVVQGFHRTEGGIVKFTAVLSQRDYLIRDIYISGDFMSFNGASSIYDLEASLRGVRFRWDRVRDIVREFFSNNRLYIPGLGLEEFLKALWRIFQRLKISEEYGFDLSTCNHISTSNGSFGDILKKRPPMMLLPYCSKPIDCDLRNSPDCDMCGRCTVGEAYQMAKEMGMDALCITSFEHLMEELSEMRRKGIRAYIGCCCEQFFMKHLEDFESSSIPAILLHIKDTTCYDLGKVFDAYKGEFENQTQIDIELLSKVLQCIK